MRRFLFVLLAGLLTIPVFSSKKTDKEMMQWEYEVQDLGQVSKDGKSVIFKIWTYSKKPSITMTQASKNAVHAVIFKQIGYKHLILYQTYMPVYFCSHHLSVF